jgi:membrane protein
VEELSESRPVHHPSPVTRPLSRRWYDVLSRALHRTLLSVIDHDCLNVAQSTAYSAIVALFPALIVAAAVIGLLPDTAPVRFQMASLSDRVLPPGVSPLLDAAFVNSPKHAHSVRALLTAGLVSFMGASNVIATLMEGLRRARELPVDCWSFWARRRRAFELVPLSLVPLAAFSMLIMFGHVLTSWFSSSIGSALSAPIYLISFLLRWVVALSASVGLIAVIYHLGVPDGYLSAPLVGGGGSVRVRRAWRTILPGAVVATAMWFLTTLSFGWYVTRYANYSEVYGSIGAAIALLFWLYIVSLSVLCGAEFNAQFDSQFHAHFGRRGGNRTRAAAAEEARNAGEC